VVSPRPRRSHDSPRPAAEIAGYRFHSLVFGFGLVATAVWFYAFFEWWGTLVAVLLCVPAGFGFTVAAPILIGTLRRTPLGNDSVMTWLPLLGGVAVMTCGAFTLSGPPRAIVALCGAALVLAGLTVVQLRSANRGR
jgi:hypothetical protein